MRKVPIILLIALNTVGAFVSPAFGGITARGICRDLQTAKRTPKVAGTELPGPLGLLEFFLDPAKAIGVAELRDGALVHLPDPRAASGSALAHPVRIYSPDRGDFPSSLDLLDHEYWKDSLADFNRDYLYKLKGEDNFEKCLAAAARIGFTDAKASELVSTMAKFLEVRNKIFEKQASEIVDRSSTLSPRIQVVRIASYQDILTDVEALKPEDEKPDLVMIFHGGLDGALEDLGGLVIPPSFFSALAQSGRLRSITVYACFPKKIQSYYREPLEELNRGGVRVYFGENQGVFKSLQEVDLGLFDDFLKKELPYLVQ